MKGKVPQNEAVKHAKIPAEIREDLEEQICNGWSYTQLPNYSNNHGYYQHPNFPFFVTTPATDAEAEPYLGWGGNLTLRALLEHLKTLPRPGTFLIPLSLQDTSNYLGIPPERLEGNRRHWNGLKVQFKADDTITVTPIEPRWFIDFQNMFFSNAGLSHIIEETLQIKPQWTSFLNAQAPYDFVSCGDCIEDWIRSEIPPSPTPSGTSREPSMDERGIIK